MTTNIPDFVTDLLDEDLADQTVVQEFKYENPLAGETGARLVSYIELGTHDRKPFQGKAKAPCRKVKLTFELLSKKHLKEIEVDGVKRIVAPTMSVTMDVLANDKAKFYKLLMRLRLAVPAKATKQNMAYFLNEPIKLRVLHTIKDEGTPKEKIYANIDFDSICEALTENPDTGVEAPMKLMDATSPIRLFLFDKPTKATWDSLFIDGERTSKDAAGKETTTSRNVVQAQILGANDFKGSAIEALLVAGEFPDITAMTAEADETEEDEVAPVEAPKAKTTKTKTTTTKTAADAMADLGLMADLD